MAIEADNKPKSFLDTLGPDIKLSSASLEPDEWARVHLRAIGEHITLPQTQTGMDYVGSFAIHITRTKDGYGSITGEYSMSSVTQIALDENLSEQLATLAFNNAVIQLRRWFNPGFKTGRRGDRR